MGFIGALSALAFAGATHAIPGEAAAQTRSAESRVEGEDYIITLSTAGTYTANKEGNLTLKLVPKTSFRLKPDFPIKLHLADPPAGHVSFSKKKLEASDGTVSETSAVFNVPFKSSAAGRETIGAKLHFKVCAAKCNTYNIDLAITVDVGAAAP